LATEPLCVAQKVGNSFIFIHQFAVNILFLPQQNINDILLQCNMSLISSQLDTNSQVS
jgi:hypothetical protein